MVSSDPTSNEDLNVKLAAALERLMQALRGDLGKHARAANLSPLQAQLLVYVHMNRQIGRQDALGVKEQAEAFGLTLGTVSAAISTLESKGLVRRARAKGDARFVDIKLTPKGRSLARKLAGWLDDVVETLAELPSDDKAVALRVLLELIAGLQRRGKIPYVRMCLSCAYFQRPSYCRLLKQPLAVEQLRIDCLEYEPGYRTEHSMQ